MIRSLIFTSLLDLSPEFGAMTTREGSDVITRVVEAWDDDPSTDVHAFTRAWLTKHPLVTSNSET